METEIDRYKRQFRDDGAIKIWYEPNKCDCKKSNKTGEIILVQYLFKKHWFAQAAWEVDGGGKCYTEKCGSGTVTRQPAYRDLKTLTGGGGPGARGISGNMYGQGNSYIDSLSVAQTLLIEAWCRCKCEDDFLLETKRITYEHRVKRSKRPPPRVF